MNTRSFSLSLMLIACHTISLSMYIPPRTRNVWKRKQEIFNTLAPKSTYISDLKSLNPNLTLNNLLDSPLLQNIPAPLQSLNRLTMIYEGSVNSTQLLQNISTKELINLINMETALLMHEDKAILETELLSHIKQKSLEDLQALSDLNEDRIPTIMQTLIKTEQIDSHLLEPYNNWLATHPTIIDNNTVSPGSYSEDLLFFNNDIKIYGSLNNEISIPNEYTVFLSKGKNELISTITTPLKFIHHDDLSVTMNQQSTYCIIYDQIDQSYTLWKMQPLNQRIQENKITVDKDITAYCFTDNNHLCAAYLDGAIRLLDLPNMNTTKEITSFTLQPDEYIIRLEFRPRKSENRNVVHVIALTNEGTIYLSRNGIVNILPSSILFPINELSPAIVENEFYPEIATDIQFSHTSNDLCIITKQKWPFCLYTLDISSPTNAPLKIIDTVRFIKPYWAQNDSIFTTYYQYQEQNGNRLPFPDPSIAMLYGCTITNPTTSNSWNVSFYPDAVASDGNSCIVTQKDISFTTTKQITLCDDTLSNAINYLNTTKQQNQPAIQRFFGTILLYKIFEKQKQITLNEEEQKIYQNYLSQDIRTILEKTDIIQPVTTTQPSIASSQQQGILASLGRPDILFNTIKTKISEHYKLLGGLSAVGIAALYHYFKSKQ